MSNHISSFPVLSPGFSQRVHHFLSHPLSAGDTARRALSLLQKIQNTWIPERKTMDVVRQSIIEHNEAWHRKNIGLLKLYLEQIRQRQEWHALITLAQWGASEKQRMLLWERAKEDFGLADPDPDPLVEEETMLARLIYRLRAQE